MINSGEGNWNIVHGFGGDTRDTKRAPMECVNIAQHLGFESDLPIDEQGETIVGQEDTIKTYDRALYRPNCPPVIIGMPHSGELVPQFIADRVERPEVFGGQVGLDTGAISIFAPRNDEFVAVRERISRMVVDPNREATDFAGKAPSNKGVCWETDLEGKPFYKPGQELTVEEKKPLIDSVFVPYFQKLAALAGSLFDRKASDGNKEHKKILFIDGHSFPGNESISAYGISAEDPKPLIILGTGKGKTEIPGIEAELLDLFTRTLEENIPDGVLDLNFLSKKVAQNEIWTGTKNIKQWGDKGAPINPLGQESRAIQIEVNRQFFMTDGKYDRKRLDMLHSAIYAAINSIADKL